MIGSIVGVILGGLLYFVMSAGSFHFDPFILASLMVGVGIAGFILLGILLALTWPVLLQAEQYLTPRISELTLKDGLLKLLMAILIIFPLITIAIALDILFINYFGTHIVIPLWVIFLGLTLDTIYMYFRRISTYLNPFEVTKVFAKEAEKCIRDDLALDMCDWIDALSDVGNKAIDRNQVALCNQCLDQMLKIIKIFFEASTSLAHTNIEGQAKEKGISDQVSFSLFFMLHRYEMLNEHAALKRLEPVNSHLMTNTGKLIVAGAVCDISLAPHPLQFLGRFALSDIKHEITEIGHKATCILLGVANSLLTDIDVKFLELKPTFFSLIDQLKLVAQEIFRQDKTISIKILTQPFHDLKTLFTNERMSNHPDTPEIIQQIDRVLQEFVALETVLKTMPQIPKVTSVKMAKEREPQF